MSSTGGVQYVLEFDLVIEEGDDPVSDSAVGDIQQDAWRILDEGGQTIVDDAKATVPVKTGALRDSIYYQVLNVDGLVIGASAVYSEYVEKAKSFLAQAINRNQSQIQAALDNMIADHLAQDTSEENPELEFDVEMTALEAD